jgi:two-component system KDP operon response regulator KdpE
LEVNLSRRLVKRRGQIVKLTPKEYELLAVLVSNSGKVMPHNELLKTVWGQEYGQEREYLRNYIRQLRQKIEDDPSNPHYIVTESHFGYRFLDSEGMPNNHPS